jgi:XTP/dITP diphosphohydrolase
MNTIYFITGNKGKLLEAKEKLSSMDIEIVQKNLGYPEVQADALEDVARFGVEYVKEQLDYPFILEDAGLFIDVLNGFPGVYSAYVFHTVGLKGILDMLKEVEADKRTALFRSVFAYGAPDQKSRFFVGECPGTITKQEFGDHGFGYDPIFVPDGETRTFAQMDVNEKNRFSHRGKSLEKLIEFFKKQ